MINNKIKIFVMGFVSAAIIFSSKNIFALGQKVYAYFCDDYKIEIDGSELKLMDGTRILNYGDRTYLSVRNIAESLGATVKWNEGNKTISINKPKAEEKIVEKTVEKIVEVPSDKKTNYQKLPLKLNKKSCIVQINGFEKKNGLAYVYLDVKNKSGESLNLNYEEAKIISNGKEYSSTLLTHNFGDAIENEDKLTDKSIIFEGTNDLEKEFTLQIPVTSANGSSYKETFEFNIMAD